MELKWDSNGTQMRLDGDSNETWIRFQWDSNGTRIRLKWDSIDSIETWMGLKWDLNEPWSPWLWLEWESNGIWMTHKSNNSYGEKYYLKRLFILSSGLLVSLLVTLFNGRIDSSPPSTQFFSHLSDWIVRKFSFNFQSFILRKQKVSREGLFWFIGVLDGLLALLLDKLIW